MRFQIGSRRGNYSVLMGLAIGTILGFGALATDITLVRLAQNQTQDVADAASQAALVQLRRTGDIDRAEAVAAAVVARNNIVEAPGTLVSLDWGVWDATTLTFDTTVDPADGANAVTAVVSREGAEAVPSVLGGFFGVDSYDTRRSSTSAMRSLEALLVMDITASWDQDDFFKARDAALAFLDELNSAHGEDDVIGMTVFHSRYGWEWTPFTEIGTGYAAIRDQWEDLNIGNLAGTPKPAWATSPPKHIACSVFAGNPSNGNSNPFPLDGAPSGNRDNFTAGQCFPNMPRYYSDEGGTDHATGMEMALTMFSERHNPMAYRALVVLTDGEPYEWDQSYRYPAGAVWTRGAYVEPYRQYTAPETGRDEGEIEAATEDVANRLWDEHEANVWFVSFKYDRDYFHVVPKGDGYFSKADTASEIEPIFVQIARSLPSAIVE